MSYRAVEKLDDCQCPSDVTTEIKTAFSPIDHGRPAKRLCLKDGVSSANATSEFFMKRFTSDETNDAFVFKLVKKFM